MKYYFYKLVNNLLSLLCSEKRTYKKLNRLLKKTPKPSILFVCMGNICRSPYGECYLNSISKHNISIKSAGLHTQDGLTANAVAREEAKKRGVNLEAHKTTVLTEELIQQHNIIFLMEPIHFLKSIFLFPSQGSKKYLLLGLLADPPLTTSITIDPYGKGIEVFENTFKTIESACNKLNNVILN